MDCFEVKRSNRILPSIYGTYTISPETSATPTSKLSRRLKRFRKNTCALILKYLAIVFIIILGIITLICYGTKHVTLKTGKISVSKVFDLLLYEFLLATASLFLFKFVSTTFKSEKIPWFKYVRIALIGFVLILSALTHLSYLFYYIPLPDELWIATVCFFAYGIYIHFAVFLVLLFLLECFSHLLCYIFNRWVPFMHFSIPILKSAIFTSTTFHTLIALLAALALVIEGFISVEVRPTIKNLNILISNLPPEFHGFSIVLVTDIHTGASVGKGKVAEVVRVVNSLDPDIITVVGDLTDGYKGYIGDRAKPLKDLRSRYGNFGTLGNHEYFYENIDNWVKFYKEDLNLTMLINEGVILERNGKQLCLAGLDDFYTEDAKFDGHKMNVTKALQDCPKNISTIILEHQPKGAAKILEEIPKLGYHADLILSGHTHGGQMYAVYPMVRLANKYLYGHYIYKETNTQIYVSSGVNYWGPPVKMMASMCEIVHIRLLSDLVVK